LNQSYSPCQELSKDMLHATCMQGNWVDSWLLVVRSQIANLTPGFSFGHNLCFKCPNGSCEPISDIYVSIHSNDIRNYSVHWVLTPAIALWRFESSPRLQIPKVKAPLRVWGFIPSHFPSLPGFLFGPQPCKPLPWSRAQS
jgi:hypothetical protein